MIGRDHVEALRQGVEQNRPLGKPIRAVQVNQRRALPAAGKAKLAAVDLDGVPDKLHGIPPPCRCALKKTKGGRRGAQTISTPMAMRDDAPRRFPIAGGAIPQAAGQCPRQWRTSHLCAQSASPPRALAIFILELSQVTFQGQAGAGGPRGHRRINPRLFTAAMHGGLQMADLNINGRTHQVDVDPDTPLLWVLRDTIGLTGTKYGCGIAQCGACTVHVDGIAMRSCSVPLSLVAGRQITTIEGLAPDGVLHKVQQAWLDHDVPQCGYCQSGMIMAVAALLKDKPKPTDADIDANLTNICRCGTYQQIRAAIHAAAASA
ncbi:MAG: (2Fe-2S)-binding protein [Alphaproteobacteria bacterium]|nr:MAG: (2Fe-2S)-binding protein [Alphaproteobacteria bacterium]